MTKQPIVYSRLRIALPIGLALLAVNQVPASLSFAGVMSSGQAPLRRAPWQAVRYIEFPEAGKLASSGRELTTGGGVHYGVDINSRVKIKINSNGLNEQLSQDIPEVSALKDRIERLRDAASKLGEAIEVTKRAVKSFARAETTKDYRVFKDTAAEMSGILLSIFTTLQEVAKDRIKEQLLEAGTDPVQTESTADNRSQELFNPILEVPGYDWELLGQLFKSEIEETEARLQSVQSTLGTDIEIQAHLLKSGGQAFPIFLRGYNEVETGPARRVNKLTFEVPEEAQQLFNSYVEMSKEIGSVKNIGDAIIVQTKVELQGLRSELEQLFSGIHDALTSARTELEAMAQWSSEEKRQQWFQSVSHQIRGTSFEESWDQLAQMLQAVNQDLESLKEYSLLAGTLQAQTPQQAMDLILAVLRSLPIGESDGLRALNPLIWQDRLSKLSRFVSDFDNLSEEAQLALTQGDSPIQDVKNAVEAVQTVFDTVKAASVQAREWMTRLRGVAPSLTASDLPVPAGQQRLLARGDVGTEFNLQTIKQEREAGDEISIQYRFFHGEEEIKGVSWSDHFRLRLFGWQDSFVAGLAVTQQKGQSDFKPTAVFSWLLKNKSYPSASQTGLEGQGGLEWFSGAGISTMPLDFSDQQDFELGVAGTVSLINNRLLFGYGANLQAEDNRGFWFFSLQLFSRSGFIPKQK